MSEKAEAKEGVQFDAVNDQTSKQPDNKYFIKKPRLQKRKMQVCVSNKPEKETVTVHKIDEDLINHQNLLKDYCEKYFLGQ